MARGPSYYPENSKYRDKQISQLCISPSHSCLINKKSLAFNRNPPWSLLCMPEFCCPLHPDRTYVFLHSQCLAQQEADKSLETTRAQNQQKYIQHLPTANQPGSHHTEHLGCVRAGTPPQLRCWHITTSNSFGSPISKGGLGF